MFKSKEITENQFNQCHLWFNFPICGIAAPIIVFKLLAKVNVIFGFPILDIFFFEKTKGSFPPASV
jgi:hypothetical protein